MQAFTSPKAVLNDEHNQCLEQLEEDRHLILISNPRVDDGKMLVMLSIADWSKDQCFYYPLECIDCRAVMIHVMWKLSGDVQYIIRTSAKMDISNKNFDNLNLHDWKFA